MLEREQALNSFERRSYASQSMFSGRLSLHVVKTGTETSTIRKRSVCDLPVADTLCLLSTNDHYPSESKQTYMPDCSSQ